MKNNIVISIEAVSYTHLRYCREKARNSAGSIKRTVKATRRNPAGFRMKTKSGRVPQEKPKTKGCGRKPPHRKRSRPNGRSKEERPLKSFLCKKRKVSKKQNKQEL